MHTSQFERKMIDIIDTPSMIKKLTWEELSTMDESTLG